MVSKEQFAAICIQVKTAAPNEALRDLFAKTDNQLAQDLAKGEISSFRTRAGEVLPYIHSQKTVPLDRLPSDFAAILAGLNSATYVPGLKALAVTLCLESIFPEMFEFFVKNLAPTSALVLEGPEKISRLNCNIRLEPGAPVYEREAFDAFATALIEGDYKNIAEFVRQINYGGSFSQHPLLKYLFRIWAESGPKEFAKFLDKKVSTDYLLVYSALRVLPVPLCLAIAHESDSDLVHLTALDLCFSRKSPINPFTLEGVGPQIIIKVTRNPKAWSQFCKYFGAFPSRHPGLWRIVGIAINGQKEEVLLELIKTFSPGCHVESRDEFAGILEGLVSSQDYETTLEVFFNSTEQVWRKHYRNRRKNLSDSSNQLELSSYYAVVLNSILRRRTISHVKLHIRGLLKYLKVSQNKWFPSQTEYRMHLMLFAGFILPYLEAYQHLKDIVSFDAAFENEVVGEIELYYGFHCYGLWDESESFVSNMRDIVQSLPPICSMAQRPRLLN